MLHKLDRITSLRDMVKSQIHYAQQEKTDAKEYTLYDSIYVKL